jgi:dTDP-L-rhamnose 4-epimerase
MAILNVLVTGGAGFIGSHLVDALVERRHNVRVLDALIPQVHPNGAPEHLSDRAELIVGDICDRQALARALEDIDVVFHKAAEVGVGQSMYEPERYMRANTMGATILLDEISKRRKKIKKIIVASSMSIYGEGGYTCEKCAELTRAAQLRPVKQLEAHDWELKCPTCGGELAPKGTSEDKPLDPTSIYAISKQDQEQLCLVMARAYGIPTVALRYFNVYGTRQALSNPYTGVCAIFSSRLLNDRPPLVFEDGEQSRDFVHISDIVHANLLALESDGADFQAVNIGTGRATTVNQIARMLARGLGKDIEPEVMGKYREGDIRHCVADITKANRLLGYTPKVKLEDGLKPLIEWVRQQVSDDRGEEAKAELAARSLMR